MSDISKAIDALNEAFRNDPGAIHALMCNRVPCNQALAGHPTVQVEATPVMRDAEHWSVGALGLINGAIEPLTGKRVAVRWSDSGPDGRRTFLGFCEYRP